MDWLELPSMTVCDERERAATGAARSDAVASVTFSGEDSSWGEFLTEDDLDLLLAWLMALYYDVKGYERV